jgi:hypothetical protein
LFYKYITFNAALLRIDLNFINVFRNNRGKRKGERKAGRGGEYNKNALYAGMEISK